ncbi:hypothetical protein LINGRAHAP2_LOCUS6721, partial [Linum grandiflorum]
ETIWTRGKKLRRRLISSLSLRTEVPLFPRRSGNHWWWQSLVVRRASTEEKVCEMLLVKTQLKNLHYVY